MQSKGIKSVRARVTNVREHLPVDMSTDAFKKGLEDEFKSTCREYKFCEQDISAINKLIEEKYSTYEWNIGRSPTGINSFTHKFPFGIFTINFDTENGCLTNVKISGDFFERQDIFYFENSLSGLRFEKKELAKAFTYIDKYIIGANGQEIVDKIFE